MDAQSVLARRTQWWNDHQWWANSIGFTYDSYYEMVNTSHQFIARVPPCLKCRNSPSAMTKSMFIHGYCLHSPPRWKCSNGCGVEVVHWSSDDPRLAYVSHDGSPAPATPADPTKDLTVCARSCFFENMWHPGARFLPNLPYQESMCANCQRAKSQHICLDGQMFCDKGCYGGSLFPYGERYSYQLRCSFCFLRRSEHLEIGGKLFCDASRAGFCCNCLSDVKQWQRFPDSDPCPGCKNRSRLGTVAAKKIFAKLPHQVARLMRLIFNPDLMRKSLVEREIDISRMPLEALSRSEIDRGFKVLSDIKTTLHTDASADNKKESLLAASKLFYTIVPHNFGPGGFSQVHVIDTEDKVSKFLETLEYLSELEISVGIQRGQSGQVQVCDEEFCYSKLGCEIVPVQSDQEIFREIERYLHSTHGASHSGYRMELSDLFSVKRPAEPSLLHSSASNRTLLWHGSRLTNWAGILSQGLKLKSSQWPFSSMFGKGIYFTDVSSKAANYCFASSRQDEGLLLLCDVALGACEELTTANCNLPHGLPAGKLSVKGCGKVAPEFYETHSSGAKIPCSALKQSDLETDLQYNEYVVYDENQVSCCFLLKIRFVFS